MGHWFRIRLQGSRCRAGKTAERDCKRRRIQPVTSAVHAPAGTYVSDSGSEVRLVLGCRAGKSTKNNYERSNILWWIEKVQPVTSAVHASEGTYASFGFSFLGFIFGFWGVTRGLRFSIGFCGEGWG